MNTMQKKYAVARVDEISSAKRKEILDKHIIEEVRLTDQEKLNLLQKGEVPFVSGRHIPRVYYIHEVFDFSGFESKRSLTEEGEKLSQELEKMKTLAKDKIMLGDESEAYEVLQNLENLEV